MHVLQRDENGLEKCVACFLCAAAARELHLYRGRRKHREKRISGASATRRSITSTIIDAYSAVIVWSLPTDAITTARI